MRKRASAPRGDRITCLCLSARSGSAPDWCSTGTLSRGKDFAAEEIGRMMVAGKDGKPHDAGPGRQRARHPPEPARRRSFGHVFKRTVRRDSRRGRAGPGRRFRHGRAHGRCRPRTGDRPLPSSFISSRRKAWWVRRPPLACRPVTCPRSETQSSRVWEPRKVNVVTSAVTGPVSGQSATCGLANLRIPVRKTLNFPPGMRRPMRASRQDSGFSSGTGRTFPKPPQTPDVFGNGTFSFAARFTKSSLQVELTVLFWRRKFGSCSSLVLGIETSCGRNFRGGGKRRKPPPLKRCLLAD